MTRDQGIEKARAWRQANWYDSVPEQLDEALYGYAADLTEELESQVRDLTEERDEAQRQSQLGWAEVSSQKLVNAGLRYTVETLRKELKERDTTIHNILFQEGTREG